MKKNNIAGAIKQMMKAGFFICLLFVSMQVGALYVDYKDNNPEGDPVKFITHQQTERYDALSGNPSQSMLKTIGIYSGITRTVWIGLFFFVMFEIFAYLQAPREHYLNKIIKKDLDKWDNEGL